jgi:hypothetical protein
MQGEAERALRCRPPSLPNRPHFDADSIDSAIPRPFDERGLYLLVDPRGGRLWRLKYRVEGSEKLLAIGDEPFWVAADPKSHLVV